MARRLLLAVVGLLSLASCDPQASSCPAPPASCADLLVRGHGYVAYRTVTPPRGAPYTLQEVANATYPACNVCHDPFEGNRATDVWHVPGASRAMAVVGLREGSARVFVIYVRQGTDPATVAFRSWAAK
jgi:hypothetical protein